MDGDQSFYTSLLQQFIKNELPPDQVAELMEWIDRNPEYFVAAMDTVRMKSGLADHVRNEQLSKQASIDLKLRILRDLNNSQPTHAVDEGGMDGAVTGLSGKAISDVAGAGGEVPNARSLKVFFIRNQWVRYAAAIVLTFGIGVYFFARKQPAVMIAATESPATANIPPGGNKAILNLADGSSIVLDNMAAGEVVTKGNMRVTKLSDGQVSYQLLDAAGNGAAAALNTMRTPRGGQYQLLLPDGSKVWLNAASSITYPTAFSENTRKVSVTGEVYFEVAKYQNKSFRVEVNGTTIEVLGTHFNVNAYDEEPATMITLLEGSVRVGHDASVETLSPGQQAVVGGDKIRLYSNVDVEQAVAWKNGAFRFNHTDISVVLRQLSRWYDVDIVYPEGAFHKQISGAMGRDLNLPEAMEVLKGLGVEGKIEGRKLYVSDTDATPLSK